MSTELRTPGSDLSQTAGHKGWLLLLLLAAAVCLALLIAYGMLSRVHAESALTEATENSAIPIVRTIHPQPGSPSQELVLPGNMQAFTDTPVYARTDGYLRRWYVDIGAHVKTGQLLAEIETPELDQQLAQAQADLAAAQANASVAHVNAERYSGLIKQNAVSQQDTDTFVSQAAATSATVRSAQANVRRLRELQGFEKIYAPFDGVITARDIDTGDLISAGSSGGARELFHLASVSRLRIYVQVPQASFRSATPGTPAELAVPELPGQRFPARVVRTSNAMEIASRTERVEVDVDNPKGVLVPGEMVEVHLKLTTPVDSLVVPVNALLFRSEGISAAIVRNGRIDLVPVTIGRDFGDTLEVISGLSAGDTVVINPSDSIAAGQKVQIASAGAQ